MLILRIISGLLSVGTAVVMRADMNRHTLTGVEHVKRHTLLTSTLAKSMRGTNKREVTK